MSGHGFTSAFATELDAYLAFKANMGFTGASRIWYLKQFDAYCAEHDRTVFDQDTVEGWVGVQLQRCGRYRSWMSYIRDVGRWMTMNGIPEAYPRSFVVELGWGGWAGCCVVGVGRVVGLRRCVAGSPVLGGRCWWVGVRRARRGVGGRW